MQDMNIYIVIGDPNDARRSATIKGNFEVLRAFLSGVGSFEMQSAPMLSSPLNIPITQAPTAKSNKRKPARKAESILTA